MERRESTEMIKLTDIFGVLVCVYIVNKAEQAIRVACVA